MSKELPAIDSIGGDGESRDGLFLTREILQRIELVRHLLENTSIVPLLTGPEGAGKSMVAGLLRRHAPEHWLVIEIDASRASSAEALLVALGEQLGLGAEVDDIETIARRLDGIVRHSRMPVVSIDDAHELHAGALSLLLDLASRHAGDRALLKMVLFSADDLTDLLKLPTFAELDEGRFQRMEMPRLSFGQALRFLREQEVAAGREPPVGSEFERLYAVSGGWPGELLHRAERIAPQSRSGQGSRPMPSARPWWIAAGAIGVVSIGLLLWFQSDINHFIAGDEDASGETPSVETAARDGGPGAWSNRAPPIHADLPTNDGTIPPETATDTNLDELVASAQPMARERSDAIPLSAGHAEAEGEPAVEASQVAAGQSRPVPEQPEEPSRDIVDLLLEEGPVDTPAASQVASPASGKAASVASSVPAEPHQPAATETRPKVVSSPPVVKSPTKSPAARAAAPATSTPAVKRDALKAAKRTTSKAASASRSNGSRKPRPRRDWLSSAPSGAYTIQLLGASRRPDLQRFARRHGLRAADLHIVRTRRNGRPWYVIVRGRYANATAARRALQRLPADLRRQGAWVRRIGSLRG